MDDMGIQFSHIGHPPKSCDTSIYPTKKCAVMKQGPEGSRLLESSRSGVNDVESKRQTDSCELLP